VGEITAADADITWTVNVANKKAAWYDFSRAMDLPEARAVERRNAGVAGADRQRLVVAPGEHSIGGTAAEPVALDGGRFLDEPVSLGEPFTDEFGRLVLLPGEGRGYSPGQSPLTSFANSDGWCDDTCDGPVLATVTIGARTLQAEPGWVVVGPPNYGPGLRAGLVTAFDSARLGWDAVDGTELAAADVSFRDDILPVLNRIVDMQWVNAGYLDSNGWGSGADYLTPELLARLADPSVEHAPLRRQIFDQFRTPDLTVEQPAGRPQIYGDGVAFPARSPYQWLAVTPIQYAVLGAWAAGTFTDDRGRPPPDDLADLSPREQVRALDRAGLDACIGGAYHPGVEVPWALRVPSMWSGPGRLRLRSTTVEFGDEGAELTPRAGDGGRRTARRQWSRRHHALDGDAVAHRRGQLSFRLRTGHFDRAADLLAGAGAEPCAARRGLPRRRRHGGTAGGPPGGVRPPLRLGALRRRRQPPGHAPQHGRPLAPDGSRHRAAGPDRRGLPGGHAGRDERRIRQRADDDLEP